MGALNFRARLSVSDILRIPRQSEKLIRWTKQKKREKNKIFFKYNFFSSFLQWTYSTNVIKYTPAVWFRYQPLIIIKKNDRNVHTDNVVISLLLMKRLYWLQSTIKPSISYSRPWVNQAPLQKGQEKWLHCTSQYHHIQSLNCTQWFRFTTTGQTTWEMRWQKSTQTDISSLNTSHIRSYPEVFAL